MWLCTSKGFFISQMASLIDLLKKKCESSKSLLNQMRGLLNREKSCFAVPSLESSISFIQRLFNPKGGAFLSPFCPRKILLFKFCILIFSLFFYLSLLASPFLFFFVFVSLFSSGVFGVLSFSLRFCWDRQHHGQVFLLLPVLWQKNSMLDNVWCLPPVVARSWWGQWGCYGRCSMPYVMYAVEGPWTCI